MLSPLQGERTFGVGRLGVSSACGGLDPGESLRPHWGQAADLALVSFCYDNSSSGLPNGSTGIGRPAALTYCRDVSTARWR